MVRCRPYRRAERSRSDGPSVSADSAIRVPDDRVCPDLGLETPVPVRDRHVAVYLSQEVLEGQEIPAVPGKEKARWPAMDSLVKVIAVNLHQLIVAILPRLPRTGGD